MEEEVNELSLEDVDRTEVKAFQKKGKVAAKSTGLKHQFEIMQSIGVPHDEIAKFADANHWLGYFPPLAIVSLILYFYPIFIVVI